MSADYRQIFSYKGESFTVTVTVHDATITAGDREVPSSKVVIDHFDGTQTSEGGITDENLLQYLKLAYDAEIQTIDGIPDPNLDAELLAAGYNRL